MASFTNDEIEINRASVVQNQPYDESLEVSDGEEIASTNATPRGLDQTDAGGYEQRDTEVQGRGYSEEGVTQRHSGYVEEEVDSPDDYASESEESEEPEEPPHATLPGAYDPAEFEHLQVSAEMKDLFKHISRYTPQTVELDTKLKPFIPDFMPAIGDIDAFLKVTRPDGEADTLGLSVIDEPTAKQSDPTVLDLQLRTLTKQTTVKPVNVHSIQDPKKQPKALDNWIESVSELHRQKPATNVHYTKNMPDIESLMQEWPPEFEEALTETGVPSADLDCDLAQYTDILCALLDIPVYNNRIHSLHVLFSLYMEFKNSQHFNTMTGEDLESDIMTAET
ncbi:intraflagellar transport protein 46 homolog isoform X2 [Halichondria panicea]|uniref:intraflagellar transport protein 46 homolog isoform X2 n=1 Tax=Halichondria panicea TaxID=6063 RepID=UPI00312BA49B